MANLLIGIIGNTLKTLVTSLISERVMLVVAYGLLKKLAKSSKNTIDDKVVVLVKEALEKKGYDVDWLDNDIISYILHRYIYTFYSRWYKRDRWISY